MTDEEFAELVVGLPRPITAYVTFMIGPQNGSTFVRGVYQRHAWRPLEFEILVNALERSDAQDLAQRLNEFRTASLRLSK